MSDTSVMVSFGNDDYNIPSDIEPFYGKSFYDESDVTSDIRPFYGHRLYYDEHGEHNTLAFRANNISECSRLDDENNFHLKQQCIQHFSRTGARKRKIGNAPSYMTHNMPIFMQGLLKTYRG